MPIMNSGTYSESAEGTDESSPLRDVVRIFNSTWDRELRSSVYGNIYKHHRKAKKWVDNPSPEDEEYVGRRPLYLRQTLVTVSVVRKLWWSALTRAFRDSRETGADIEYPLPDSVRADMFKCDPAGLLFKKDHLHRTCGRHAVCPWCRYRYGLWICERMAPFLGEADSIASATVIEGGAAIEGRLSPSFHQLIKKVTKTKRPWMYDVTIPMPLYDWHRKLWHPSVTIVALVKKETKMPHPEAWCSYENWTPQPVFLGSRGRRYKANRTNLAHVVAGAVRYPADILFASTPAHIFLQIASFSRWCRAAFHGIPRGSSRE